MKNISHLLLSLLIITIFSFSKCKKNEDPTKNAVLPAATQEGKNTVGFILNNEVWIPYSKCGFGADPCGEISARYSTPLAAPNAISFQFARIRDNASSDLTFSSSGIGTITTVGNKIDSIQIDFFAEGASGNNGNYAGPLTGSKFIITKIDMQNQIIAGEFEFVLREQNGTGRQITLKDGRFDFKFNACKCSN